VTYEPRYSFNDEPDKMGRWQGKLFTENYIVERIESNGVIKFIVNTYFPLTGNDCPNKHEICSTYEDAKW
jgi:hypothetical protein